MRVRRSMLNFGTSVLLMAVTTAVALKSTPMLVHWLGEKRFGGYRVVFDGYGYLTLLELGLGGALGPLLARALQGEDEGALRRTVAAGARAYVGVSLLTVVVGLMLTPFVHRLAAGLTPAMVADLRRGWVIGLASFLSLALVPARTLVEARQSGYVINLMLTAQSLITTGLALVLARADWGITGQAVAQVVGVWAFGLTLTALASRAHPGLVRAAVVERTDAEARTALRNLSAPTLLFNVAGRISVLTDNFVVGGILGVKDVTSLFNTQRLVVLGQTVLQSVGNASWAALAELNARGERETFNRRLVEMTRLVAVLAAVGFVPVVAFNRAFLRLWLPEMTYGGDLVAVVAAVNAVLLAEQALWAWCFTATGKIRELLPLSLAAAVLNLAASVALTHRLGVVGPLLGSTVAFVSVGLWMLPWRLRATFGTPVGPLLRAVAWPSLAGAVAAAGLWWLVRDRGPTTWLGLVAGMGASALAMLAFSVVALLTPADRELWKQRLAPMLGRRGVSL